MIAGLAIANLKSFIIKDEAKELHPMGVN